MIASSVRFLVTLVCVWGIVDSLIGIVGYGGIYLQDIRRLLTISVAFAVMFLLRGRRDAD